MKKSWLVLCLAMFTILFGCENGETNENRENDKLSVVTSFYPMYEFTRQVAGDRADVSLMLSNGEDAHHYEPSAKDVAHVNKADVFVYSSDEMEYWVDSLLKSMDNDEIVIARAGDAIETVQENKEQEKNTNKEGTKKVTIQGVADHYHTDDAIVLSAELSEESELEHWHWYTRENKEDEWSTVPNQGGPVFVTKASGKSFEVRAVLFDNAHNEYAQSQSVNIVIDDHGQTPDHSNQEEKQNADDQPNKADKTDEVEIIGLADHYHTGDVVTLEAQPQAEMDFNQWQWHTRKTSTDEWKMVAGQETNHFEYKTTGESFDVKAVLLDNNQNTLMESEVVSVKIDDHENQDPHIWLDPVLAQDQVNIIRDALIKADPEGKAIYERNAEEFNKELQNLHEEYQSTFKNAKNTAFVVQHQAFGYIADRYHLQQIAIGGLSTEVEPSPSRMAEIGELVKEYKVPVIYYQQGANSAIAETVANETGTKTAILYDLEVLSKELESKDLGYIEAMRENLKSLQISIK